MGAETKSTAEQSVAELLTYIKDGIESGGEFVMEQAPLLVQEIVLYGRVKWTVFCFALMSIVAFAVYSWVRRGTIYKAYENADDDDSFFPRMLVSSVAGLMAAGFLFPSAESLIRAWLAPRLYVLEFVRQLLR